MVCNVPKKANFSSSTIRYLWDGLSADYGSADAVVRAASPSMTDTPATYVGLESCSDEIARTSAVSTETLHQRRFETQEGPLFGYPTRTGFSY